jgi:hypothetical protein
MAQQGHELGAGMIDKVFNRLYIKAHEGKTAEGCSKGCSNCGGFAAT